MIEAKTKLAAKQASASAGAAIRQRVIDSAIHVKDCAQVVAQGAFQFGRGLVFGTPPKRRSS